MIRRAGRHRFDAGKPQARVSGTESSRETGLSSARKSRHGLIAFCNQEAKRLILKHWSTDPFCGKVLEKQRPSTVYESEGQELESLRARHCGIRYRRQMLPILRLLPAALTSNHSSSLRR